MKNKILTPLFIGAFIIPCALGCNKTDNSCNIIKNNYRNYVFNTTNIDDYASKPINKIREELESKTVCGMETYKFIGLDYDTDWSRSSWEAASHLSRALKIAIVAENRNSDELRDIAKKLTYHWVFSNYHNINWWQNELGANSTLANLGLITFDYLGKKGQDAFNGKIRESSLKWRPSISTHTGANVFDYIDITCRNAAINNDKEEMNIAFNRLTQEINNDGVEGFQKDGSFFQHGRQVQNVSYGKSIIRVARTMYKFKNTNYKMSDNKMKILSDYVLKGLAASTYKGYTNYTTVSREYSRPDNLDTQKNGFKDLAYFMGIDNYPGKEETYNFLDSIINRKNAYKNDEIIYFPIAKMIVANIGHDKDHEGIYISYKASEPNLVNTECVNGENQLGLNLSYGTNTCVMDKGDEYFNIAPVMNYSFMPGTSSVEYSSNNHSNDETILHYAQGVYGDSLYGEQLPKVGDLGSEYTYNDGQVDGVTFSMTKTMHHKRGRYTVTCFTTNDGMVLVGSDLSYAPFDTDPKGSQDYALKSTNMHTTVDQYLTDDEESTDTKPSFLNHNNGNVKYVSLDDKELVKNIIKPSYTVTDWKRNNRDVKVDEKTPGVTKNLSTITINGDNISNYAYAIQPNNSSKTFKLAAKENNVHAIELPNGQIAAAFYKKDAKFNYEDKTYSLPEDVPFKYGKGAFVIMDKK